MKEHSRKKRTKQKKKQQLYPIIIYCSMDHYNETGIGSLYPIIIYCSMDHYNKTGIGSIVDKQNNNGRNVIVSFIIERIFKQLVI